MVIVLIMLHQGQIAFGLENKRKKQNLTVPKLMELFHQKLRWSN